MTKGGIEARSMIASGVDAAYASRQRRGAFQPAATASELDLVNQDGVPGSQSSTESRSGPSAPSRGPEVPLWQSHLLAEPNTKDGCLE